MVRSFPWMARGRLRAGSWNCCGREQMPVPSEPRPTIGYVVSTWPRLSQTFVLNEILALEKRGLPVRIFSTKDPDGEPVHAKLAKVRAPVTYLSFRRRVRAILLANVRIARRRPGAYARTLLLALRLGRAGVLWRLLQAGYLADLLRRDAVAHLDRKSTRLNSSHGYISYAVFCLKKKKQNNAQSYTK